MEYALDNYPDSVALDEWRYQQQLELTEKRFEHMKGFYDSADIVACLMDRYTDDVHEYLADLLDNGDAVDFLRAIKWLAEKARDEDINERISRGEVD